VLNHPAAALLLALASTMLLARLVRMRPSLSPLLAPYALTALGLLVSRSLPLDPLVATALVAAPLLVLLVRASVLLFEGVFRRRQGMDAPALLGSVVSVLLYGIGAGVVAKMWFGVDLTPFLATSAVVGAVVGLALQDTLGNLFAGIALHSEAPFRVGDWVRVADKDGRVEQVSWRATRLRTWDGDALTVPNSELAKHAVLNYSVPRGPHTRVLQVGVAYHVPPNKVLSVLMEIFDQVDGVPNEPPISIRVIAYHEYSIAYEVRYPFRAYEDWRRIEHEVNRLIWYHFRRHAIEIPFPIRNVYLHQVDRQVDGRETPALRLQRTLRGVDLFRPLSDDELLLSVRRFRPLHYAAGEKILEEGGGGDSFFVIDSGQVDVLKTIGGVQRKVARLWEGQFFGEMALLTGEKRAATVVAATDVDLYTLDKAGFQDVLVANPEIAVEISAILTTRREALHQAEGDITRKYDASASAGEKQQRLLERIRSYFGL
jgi:small-conductance mechanosensitive channel/CRP-like cAMP-binding protein